TPTSSLFPYTTLFRSPCGTRSIEGGIAPQVGVFGQRSCINESMYGADSRDQVERGNPRTPPLCRQNGGEERNDDYDDDAVSSLRSEEHTSELQSRENI